LSFDNAGIFLRVQDFAPDNALLHGDAPMEKIDGGYVIVLPWYDRDEFERLSKMSNEGQMPATYEQWKAQTEHAAKTALARGLALELIPVRADEYFAWLTTQCRTDSAETRARYMEELAASFLRASSDARSKEKDERPVHH
jgi:hypothetical protein